MSVSDFLNVFLKNAFMLPFPLNVLQLAFLNFTGDLQIKLHLADLIAAFTQPSGKQCLGITLAGKRVY